MLKYIPIALLFFISLNLLGQSKFVPVNDSKVIEQKLLEASSNTKTIACNFTQIKQLEYLSTAIESSGKFWFANGNKLRWEYTEPFKYIITINDGVFTIKDDDKISVFDTKSNKAFKELNDILMSTVDGSLMNSGKFEYSVSENDQAYLVKLTPKGQEMKEILSNINLYFSKSDLTVFKVKMIETEQDYTIISFTEKNLNKEIDPTLFQLK